MMSGSKHARVLAGLAGLVTAGVLLPEPILAQERGGLSNLIRDLYGGDGIQPIGGPVGGTPEHHPFRPSFVLLDDPDLFDLNDEIGRNIAFAPFNAAAAAIVFDIERGVPVRADDSLGPFLVREASTIGQNRMSFGVSYARIDYQNYEGDDLDDQEFVFSHTDCCPPGGTPSPGQPTFEQDQIRVNLDLELTQDIFAFFSTYGITNNWDVGLVVPIVSVDASVRSVGTIIPSPNNPDPTIHQFDRSDPDPDLSGVDSNSDSATGIGDIAFRSKYNFLRDQPVLPDAAVLGQVTLPTGDDDDLLGSGDTAVLGLLIGTKDFGRFSVHGNVGYEMFFDDLEDALRYGAGTDVLVFDGVTAVGEVLGRYEPNGDGTSDVVDGLVGLKWNPTGDVVLSSFVLTPINRDTGLRADVVWGFGLELGF